MNLQRGHNVKKNDVNSNNYKTFDENANKGKHDDASENEGYKFWRHLEHLQLPIGCVDLVPDEETAKQRRLAAL